MYRTNVSDLPTLEEVWDPRMGTSWRDLYRGVRFTVWIIGIFAMALLAAFVWRFNAYDWATDALIGLCLALAGLCLLLFWSGLKKEYQTLRHDKMMRIAYYEMSDLHRAFLQYVRDAVVNADEDMLEEIRGEHPRLFWEELVDRRLGELRKVGISEMDAGVAVGTHCRYQSPYQSLP